MAATISYYNPQLITYNVFWPTSVVAYKDDYKGGGRYVFHCPDKDYQKIKEWCLENFGAKHRKRWGCNKTGTIYISDPDLAMAFKLRWIE